MSIIKDIEEKLDFKTNIGIIIAILSLIIALIFVYCPKTKVYFDMSFIFLIIALILGIYIIIETLVKEKNIEISILKQKLDKQVLPKILKVNSSKNEFKIFLQPSSLFDFDTLVSIYFEDNCEYKFGSLIGVGRVSNISNSNGIIEVDILELYNVNEQIKLGLKNSNLTVLKCIKVKPIFKFDMLQKIILNAGDNNE